MALTTDDLHEIVAGSSTLFERVARPFLPDALDLRAAAIDRRIERWRQRVAGGSAERFERYLRWNRLDGAAARRAVGPVLHSGADLPEWVEVLAEADRTAPALVGARAPCGSGAVPQPFEEALIPFVHAARRRLQHRLAQHAHTASESASLALERMLYRRLARIAARTLYAEFSAFRAVCLCRRGAADPLALSMRAVVEGDRPVYDRFVRRLLIGGLARLLRAYPVLARLLAACVLDWTDSTAEFFLRVESDRDLLERVFGGNRLGAIVDVQGDLSDPHRGGRTVSGVRFESGLELIYKPRNLGLELAFTSLLLWANDRRVSLGLKAPRVLNRGSHGWMECVPALACCNRAEVERYYRRAGMLLCMAYVFGAGDLHQANLIASGEFPVLVDLEVLLSAPARPDAEVHSLGHAWSGEQIFDSVLRTGLLPVDRPGLHGRYNRNGGLANGDVPYGKVAVGWDRVNTDLMRLELRAPVRAAANVPQVDEMPFPVEEHAASVVSGFGEMSAALRRSNHELLAPGGVLDTLRRQRRRVVLRDTLAYATLLEQLLHPRFLRDGADWSIELEILKASATAAMSKPRSWTLCAAEQRALCRLDIPLFESAADGNDVEGEGCEPVRGYFAQSGYAAAVSRLRRLGADAVSAHTHSIHVALRSRSLRAGGGDISNPAAPWDDPQRLVAEAVSIGQRLRSVAFEAIDTGPSWITMRGENAALQRRVQWVGWDLYGGRSGIALLFAALERRGLLSAGDGESFAVRVLRPLASSQNTRRRRAPAGANDATLIGLGGLVYALTKASELAASAELLDAAARVAASITPDLIDGDDALDVLRGSAGAALALLALYAVTPKPFLLDRAVHCGRHLLARSFHDSARRSRRWRTSAGFAPAGFAHGSAGIAYALARLYRATGINAFRRAAQEGTRACTSRTPPGRMQLSWCQGSSGIGLSRLAMAGLLGAPQLLDGVSLMLQRVAACMSDLLPRDHVCCGNMGRIAFLAHASGVLGDPTWYTAARKSAGRVIRRRQSQPGYAVGAIDDVLCPGYYQGLAGIGYELLRLGDPDLPAVLLWE